MKQFGKSTKFLIVAVAMFWVMAMFNGVMGAPITRLDIGMEKLIAVLTSLVADDAAITAAYTGSLNSQVTDATSAFIWNTPATANWTKNKQAFTAIASGVPVSGSADTALPLPAAGTISHGKYNASCYQVDSAGTVTTVTGTEGSSYADITMPTLSAGKAVLGCTYVWNTSGSAFAWGSTALNTSNVTVTHRSFTGPVKFSSPTPTTTVTP